MRHAPKSLLSMCLSGAHCQFEELFSLQGTSGDDGEKGQPGPDGLIGPEGKTVSRISVHHSLPSIKDLCKTNLADHKKQFCECGHPDSIPHTNGKDKSVRNILLCRE